MNKSYGNREFRIPQKRIFIGPSRPNPWGEKYVLLFHLCNVSIIIIILTEYFPHTRYILFYSIFTAWWGRIHYYHPHFTDEATETQRINYPMVFGCKVGGLGFTPRQAWLQSLHCHATHKACSVFSVPCHKDNSPKWDIWSLPEKIEERKWTHFYLPIKCHSFSKGNNLGQNILIIGPFKLIFKPHLLQPGSLPVRVVDWLAFPLFFWTF